MGHLQLRKRCIAEMWSRVSDRGTYKSLQRLELEDYSSVEHVFSK